MFYQNCLPVHSRFLIADAWLCIDLSRFVSWLCDGLAFGAEMTFLRFSYRYYAGNGFQGFYAFVFFYLFFAEGSQMMSRLKAV
ncbi:MULTISPECIES: hypothetical protein [Pseudanabaena]|uniref:Uncharacterized protein n=2 Tax=Pseudanabaena TaxID=1152 RepID=L8MWR3_9CYAN|nr:MULTISPECIES: hypothetical protein [Pseudanabaena]ELS32427.1 hypothetical protein Pse7429DRAFT_2579 [Pseudanabaena biceps PCC 7429]MDG3495349.1 hypothetical protein [Pseudanabaena catenata USMAC16]